MLTELNVVNSCLGTMGQAPLLNLDRPHRLAAAAMTRLRDALVTLHSFRWWFNTARVTVTPVAPDYLVQDQLPPNLTQITGPFGQALSLRAPGVLYDHNSNEIVRASVEVEVTYQVPFAELPPMAQIYVRDVAVLAFQSDYDGDGQRTARLEAATAASFIVLNAEHIRTMKINLLQRPTTGYALYRSRGTRPYLTTR